MRDVAVIGLGPAGATWAKKLRENDTCNVTVYEKRNLIKNYNPGTEPRRLRGLIGQYASEIVKQNSLPYEMELRKALLTSILGVVMKVDSEKFGHPNYGYTVSDNDINRKLAADAASKGAKILDGTNVTDIRVASDSKMVVNYDENERPERNIHDFIIYSGDYKAPYLDKHFGRSESKKSYTIAEIETKGNIKNSEFGHFDTVFEPKSPFGYDTAALFGKDDVISFQCVAPTKILPTVEDAKRAMKKEMPRMAKKYGIDYRDINYEGGGFLSTETRGDVVADGIILGGASSAGLQSRISATGISQSIGLVDGTFGIISDSIQKGNFSKNYLQKYQNVLDEQRKIYGKDEKVQGVLLTPVLIDILFELGNAVSPVRNIIANRLAFEKSYIKELKGKHN